VEERYEYDAFGTPYQGDFSSGLNPGYTGKPYDPATGLYNYGYRDYQPAVARFTTVDPIRDGSNWFAYVNNDPVNWVDLWGLNASDRNNNQILGLTGTQNTLLGVGEMVLGVVLFVGGPVLAGTISTVAPPASTAAFSTVGYTGVIVGGGFIAVGLARVAGGV
jgi:RHS repeat-associated protein